MLVRRIVSAGALWAGLSVLCCGLMLNVTGCDAPKPAASSSGGDAHGHAHDHDELPMGTYAESVGSLRKLHDQIKTAMEAKKPDDAHDALHEIGHVLEAVEKQSADKPEPVKTALKQLFDGYGQIDGAMHDGKDPDYASLDKGLSEAVATLEGAK